MWKVLTDAVRGTSHEKSDTPCQDACQAVVVDVAGAQYLVAACSDGAGSARASEIGSRATVEFFASRCAELLLQAESFSDADMRELYTEATDHLAGVAAGNGVQLRDLACTLLGAVVGPSGAVCAQLGDGAIVTRVSGGAFAPVFWPEPAGEFANETVFLTSPNAKEALLVTTTPPIEEIALFSDGLQRLALTFADRGAHAGFFAPLFAALAQHDAADLVIDLRMFLNSRGVNSRTDDDKSIVLAKRCGELVLCRSL